MVEEKMWTDVSILSGVTGASVTHSNNEKEYEITCNFSSNKVPDPKSIYQQMNHEKNPSLPPHLAKYPPVHKSLTNDAHNPNITEDVCNGFTYTSRN